MVNRRKDRKLVRVTVNLDPDDYKRFDSLATAQGLSAAWLVRKAMREMLERLDNKLIDVEESFGHHDATD